MPTPPAWRALGAVEPHALVEARLLLHHAAQLVTAPGRSLVPPRPDDGHTALEWLDSHQALAGEPVQGRDAWRAALRPADLTLLVLAGTTEAAAFPLEGRTVDEGWAWLRDQASLRGADAARLSREAPYRIPAHPVASGQPFPSSPLAGCGELARYFANSDGALRAAVAGRAGASAVRCWPHHFDIGAVLTLDPAAGRTIGMGLSPGDETVPEPYWYVNAFPAPTALPDPLPPLPAEARWSTEGWLGAVLTATALVSAGDGHAQEAKAGGYLRAAEVAMRALLEKRPQGH